LDQKVQAKAALIEGLQLVGTTPRKSLIESLVIKDCVKSQNTKPLETSDSPKHQHTIEFHFGNFTQQDRSLLSPWKILSCHLWIHISTMKNSDPVRLFL